VLHCNTISVLLLSHTRRAVTLVADSCKPLAIDPNPLLPCQRLRLAQIFAAREKKMLRPELVKKSGSDGGPMVAPA